MSDEIEITLDRTVSGEEYAIKFAFEVLRSTYVRVAARRHGLKASEEFEPTSADGVFSTMVSGREKDMVAFLEEMRDAKVVGFDCFTDDARVAGILYQFDPVRVVDVPSLSPEDLRKMDEAATRERQPE